MFLARALITCTPQCREQNDRVVWSMYLQMENISDINFNLCLPHILENIYISKQPPNPFPRRRKPDGRRYVPY